MHIFNGFFLFQNRFGPVSIVRLRFFFEKSFSIWVVAHVYLFYRLNRCRRMIRKRIIAVGRTRRRNSRRMNREYGFASVVFYGDVKLNVWHLPIWPTEKVALVYVEIFQVVPFMFVILLRFNLKIHNNHLVFVERSSHDSIAIDFDAQFLWKRLSC